MLHQNELQSVIPILISLNWEKEKLLPYCVKLPSFISFNLLGLYLYNIPCFVTIVLTCLLKNNSSSLLLFKFCPLLTITHIKINWYFKDKSSHTIALKTTEGLSTTFRISYPGYKAPEACWMDTLLAMQGPLPYRLSFRSCSHSTCSFDLQWNKM